MPKFLVLECDEVFRERIVTAIAGLGAVEIATATEPSAARADVDRTDPDVLIVGPSYISQDAFDLASWVSAREGTETVFMAAQVDTDLMRSAMRAGVTDVVSATEPVSEVASAVQRAAVVAAKSRSAQEAAAESEGRHAKVVTVFSTKGGVGKTVLSTNLAVALAQDTGKRVALVDLDLEFGDVAIMLGLEPAHTIFDAVQAFDRLDADMLEGFMERHNSGVFTLLAPVRPEDAESISAARVGQILDLIAENYDYLVVDTCPSFSEAVLAALDRSDEIYIVTMMDVASIKNTRISMQKLRQLGLADGRVRLVLNRSDSKVLLQLSEVETAMGGKVTAKIPSDRLVPRSVNKGVPIIVDAPKSEVSKSIAVLAKDAANHAAKEATTHVA